MKPAPSKTRSNQPENHLAQSHLARLTAKPKHFSRSAGIGAKIGIGLGVGLGGVLFAQYATADELPAAKAKSGIQIAACNPCGACGPCNPCNPCGAANPCAGSGGGASSKCVVPRLQKAAANPCGPCAAVNPCNPCAAKNPCNPCAAANPCNPCGAANPCGPCGAGTVIELSPAEAGAAYACLKGDIAATYSHVLKGYTAWVKANTAPYNAATHGGRYVNNYVNGTAAKTYLKFEAAGEMPAGSVIAKDSFTVKPDGKTDVGPLFVMEKMKKGWNEGTDDWRYTMVLPSKTLFGTTKGKGSAKMGFCHDCHGAVADEQDSLMFLPDDYRVN